MIRDPRDEERGPKQEFPEVPNDVLRRERWNMLWAAPFQHDEAIAVKETRSILAAPKHRTRDSSRHNSHELIFNDNFSSVMLLSKGRSNVLPLLCLCRRYAAESLPAGILAHVRWIPSEVNVADESSRLFEKKAPRNTRNNVAPDAWLGLKDADASR